MHLGPEQFKITAEANGRLVRMEGDFDDFASQWRKLEPHLDAEEFVFACNHWRNLDLSFLLRFRRLRTLRLAVAYDEISLTQLGRLADHASFGGLREIALSQPVSLDLSQLHGLKLERLSLNASKKTAAKLKAVGEQLDLRYLKLIGLKAADFVLLSPLIKLEELEIHGNVTTTLGIEELIRLERLTLNCGLRRIARPITALSKLRLLDLNYNRDWNEISGLQDLNIVELALRDIKRLKSLQPLGRLHALQRLVLHGTIDDNDISPILRLPELRYCELLGREYFGQLLHGKKLSPSCEWVLL